MTLVIARCAGARVRFISDTRATFLKTQRLPPDQGTLKVVPVRDRFCVGFAGSIDLARPVLDAMTAEGASLAAEDILGRLEAAHRKEGVDFILAESGAEARMWRVAEGQVEPVRFAYIGSHEAFAVLQRYRLGPDGENDADEFDRDHRAFHELVHANECLDAGDFVVEVGTRGDAFHYKYAAGVFFPPRESVSESWSSIATGTAEEGAYGYVVLPMEAPTPGVCIFLELARWALVFTPFSDPVSLHPIDLEGLSQYFNSR